LKFLSIIFVSSLFLFSNQQFNLDEIPTEQEFRSVLNEGKTLPSAYLNDEYGIMYKIEYNALPLSEQEKFNTNDAFYQSAEVFHIDDLKDFK